MLLSLRAAWRRLPIPYAVRSSLAPIYGKGLEWITRPFRSKPLPVDTIVPGPVILSGYLSDTTGIGRAGRLTLEEIGRWGVPIVAHDLRRDPNAKGVRGHVPEGGVWVCHCNPPQVLELMTQLTDKVWASRYRIGYWAYELEELPADWCRVIGYFHEIWAPSTFVADAIRRGRGTAQTEVRVVPHPVPDPVGLTVDRSLVGPGDRFVFLAMLDARSSYARKNPMGVVTAFQRAFKADDAGVGLIIKVVQVSADPASFKALSKAVEGWPNIEIRTGHVGDGDAVQLIAASDCLVSLHRSEGFGLTIAEAMTVGTPVIATDWSGNVDYSRGAVMGIPYRLVATEDSSGRYAQAGAQWAEPDLDAAAAAMMRVREDEEFRSSLVERARVMVRERLDQGVPVEPYARFIAG